MMKKKTIAWMLLLLLMLGALSGCKQQDGLESAAPGEVVEKPESEPVEQDTPTVVDPKGEEEDKEPENETPDNKQELPETGTPQPENPGNEETPIVQEPSKTETPQPTEPEFQDIFFCEFTIYIKPEMAKESYVVEDFPEFEQVDPNSDPTEFTNIYYAPDVPVTTFQVRAEFHQKEHMNQVIEKLRTRADYKDLRVKCMVYQKPSDQADWSRPVVDKKFNSVRLETGEEVTDKQLLVGIQEAYAANKPFFALSDFPEVDADAIEYYYYFDSQNLSNNALYIIFYLKESGAESLKKAAVAIRKNPMVSVADYNHVMYQD